MNKFKYYTPLILQKFGYVLFLIIYKCFVRIEVTGRENLFGVSGPLILAANHTSELDVTALPLILPFWSKLFPIYFVSNPTEKFKTFGWRRYIYGGIFFNMLGGYQIYSGRKNYAISLDNHIKLLRQGKTVCIFPEGKRTLDGKLNPARGGLGYLSYVTSATVIPVAIDTFFNISLMDIITFRRRILITVCRPVPVDKIVSPKIKNPSVTDFRGGSQIILDIIKEVLDHNF